MFELLVKGYFQDTAVVCKYEKAISFYAEEKKLCLPYNPKASFQRRKTLVHKADKELQQVNLRAGFQKSYSLSNHEVQAICIVIESTCEFLSLVSFPLCMHHFDGGRESLV